VSNIGNNVKTRKAADAPAPAGAPVKWRTVVVEAIQIPAWDWRENPVAIGVVLESAEIAVTYEGKSRNRVKVVIECEAAGALEKRCLFLPPSFGAAIKRCEKRWIRVTRSGEGAETRYTLETGV
jgi:hypothetical protein